LNVAFFIIPKVEVVTLLETATVRQVLEKMEYHRYSCVPVINKSGQYIGTITEGDVLWGLKKLGHISVHELEHVYLEQIPRYRDYKPISINDEIEDIFGQVTEQNFIPIIDDQGVFIGIVRRREVIEYCSRLMLRAQV